MSGSDTNTKRCATRRRNRKRKSRRNKFPVRETHTLALRVLVNPFVLSLGLCFRLNISSACLHGRKQKTKK